MRLIESLKNWMKKKKFSRKNEHWHSLVRGSTRTGMTDSNLQVSPEQSDDSMQKEAKEVMVLAQSDLSQIRNATQKLSEEEKNVLLRNTKILIRQDPKEKV
jgi:hypothetical protein